MRATLVLALAACGSSSSKPAPPPCERAATIEVRLVDHDSPYMKKAFDRVNPDPGTGLARDADALAAGVGAEVDMWRRDTRDDELPGEEQVDYFLTGKDRESLAGYLAKLAKVPDDRELVIESRGAGVRTYYVFKQPIIETRHVADVSVAAQVRLDLTADGKALFATATAKAAKASRKIATLVDGEVLGAPIVNTAIEAGRFSIASADPAALAKRLACVTAPGR